jgi:soluble cytochrome b562
VGQQSEMSALHTRAVADAAAIVTAAANTRAKAVAGQLAAMRKAMDAATLSIEKLFASPIPVDAEITAFVDGLTKEVEELAQPAGDVEALEKQLQERETQNQELRKLLVKARMDLEAARADLAAERENTDTVRASAAELTGEFDRAFDEMRREHATVLAEQSAACTTLPLDELLTVFSALKRAETGPELLGALLTGLAREFSRVALFHVDGTRLVAAERLGFRDEDTTKPIRLPADSILTRAVSSGRLESVMPSLRGEPNTSLPFGGTPSCALAMPIVVQGATAAVIYADDSDHVEFATSAPQVRVKFAELLQQYALLVLLRISVERKSSDDLRGLAASLVAELEYTYTTEAEAGRNRLECQTRLKEALQMARRRFAERAEGGDPAAVNLFDEQLAATMTARKESAFCRDLAALLGSARPRGDRGNIVAMFR